MGEVGVGTVVGRYAIYEEIAAGGRATVHYGRLMGPVGFSRPVAVKRLHAHLAKDPEFVTMFLDEARVAARVRHPNVVATLDIVTTENQLFLVMEYVEGETVARLLRRAKMRNLRLPVGVSCSIMVGVLHGLHAAHEATNERKEPLCLIHRDVSPQNIMVGLDGVARVLDFGVAKAIGRLQTTREGQLKGKLAYMAPEYFTNGAITRSVDIYAASVVLWELLAGTRLFPQEAAEATLLGIILHGKIDPPSKHNPDVTPELDAIVLRGLERDPAARFATAREMAREIEHKGAITTTSSVGEWVESLAQETLQERARKVAEIESNSDVFEKPSGPDELSPSLSPSLVRPKPVAPKEAEVKIEPPPKPLVVAELPSSDLLTDLHNPGAAPLAPAPHRPPTFWLALIGLSAVVVIAVAVLVGRRPDVTREPPVPSATASAISEPAPVATPTPSPPTTTTAPSASAFASASASARPTARPATVPTTKKGCNPPYVVDEHGVKKYKVDCL